VGTLTGLTVASTSTLPFANQNGCVREFAHRIAKTPSNTHTITILFEDQSSAYAPAIVEILFTASRHDFDATRYGGRCTVAITSFSGSVSATEIEDAGVNVTFASTTSGNSLVITATTNGATPDQEPSRIGVFARVLTGGSVANNALTMTIA
jgi:hypothetical protein